MEFVDECKITFSFAIKFCRSNKNNNNEYE